MQRYIAASAFGNLNSNDSLLPIDRDRRHEAVRMATWAALKESLPREAGEEIFTPCVQQGIDDPGIVAIDFLRSTTRSRRTASAIAACHARIHAEVYQLAAVRALQMQFPAASTLNR